LCQNNDDEVCFSLDQHTEVDFYSASLLQHQSAGRHVAPLGHIILIPSQSIFALSLSYKMIDWCLMPTLTVFQLNRGVNKFLLT
jgi:hypothetical protein